MPIFDFTCPACGAVELDKLVRMDQLPPCEHCGTIMLKEISAPNLVGFDSQGTSRTKSESNGKG